MAALTIVPRPKLSLYDLEEHLSAMLDTEEAVPPELEEAFDLELHDAMIATVEKRDRVGQFMAHLEAQIAFAHSEIKRLQDRESFYSKVFERMEGYVLRVIDSLGLDAKGKYKKLEGNTITFSRRGCEKRAEVTDETLVPSRYKRVTITMPVDTWDLLCDSLDLELCNQVLADVRPKLEVSTSLVKTDLKADLSVPGCKLAGGFYLVRK